MQSGAAGADRKENTVILIAGVGADSKCSGGESGKKENCGRNETVDALKKSLQNEFPDCEVRGIFTGGRDRLAAVRATVLERATADGTGNLIVQPLCLMDGYKYMELAKLLEDCKEKFNRVTLGRPLLSSDADFTAVAKAITEKTTDYSDGETAICFVGHGTEAASNIVYRKMQEVLWNAGYENYYIGTIKAAPALSEVTEMLRRKGMYRRVVLAPFMVAAGIHARGDIAGEGACSWKSVLQREGYDVTYISGGLGETPAVRDLFVKHAGEAFTAISSDSLWD